MRISDWSSDVCSSDLVHPHDRIRRRGNRRPRRGPARQPAARPRVLSPRARVRRAPGAFLRRDVAAAQGRRGVPLRDRDQRGAGGRGRTASVRRRAHRHHPAKTRRAGAALPRQLRHPDQPAQPHPAVGALVAGDRACPAREQPRRGAVHRPGPIQGHQRLVRPRHRRTHPPPGAGGPAAARPPAPNPPHLPLLSERLSRAIVRARRENNRVAVLFLDLDRFKYINDSLGHAAGDRILRSAAVRLQQTVGQHHTVARLSGDEFTVVLENLESLADADKVAREIIMAFEAPLIIDERQEISISPSIGISVYPDHGQVPTELLKQADTAMYQAKAAGRRTFARYDDAMDVSVRQRATISGALRKVIDRGELDLAYQPRLALQSSRITGVEALLRWTSEEHGEIPPSEFIPLAEESGQILEIGEWVLREACLTLHRWRQHGLADLNIAVNMSVLQLLRGNFPDVVQRILADTGVPASALELELTESVLMANAAQTAGKLQAFREIGVSLAIDDFGTGYSSLAYLKRLPITTIKIDKEFIGDLSRDPDDAAITSTVITMAHSLGLNVVAEGVETQAQLQFLRAQKGVVTGKSGSVCVKVEGRST